MSDEMISNEVYNPDIETIISTAIESDVFNISQAEYLVDTLNKYYGNAGLRAKLSDHNELTIAVKPPKAQSTVTRGRSCTATYSLVCEDIKRLMDKGLTDKQIMARYGIPKATYYRKKKAMQRHNDMARPF
jgi:hypothetical protein